MKSIKDYIKINESSNYSTFNKEDAHYVLADWKRWEKKYEKEFNIFYDEDSKHYFIYTKTKGNEIGMHVGTYNSLDGIFYYNPEEIKDIYAVK